MARAPRGYADSLPNANPATEPRPQLAGAPCCHGRRLISVPVAVPRPVRIAAAIAAAVVSTAIAAAIVSATVAAPIVGGAVRRDPGTAPLAPMPRHRTTPGAAATPHLDDAGRLMGIRRGNDRASLCRHRSGDEPKGADQGQSC